MAQTLNLMKYDFANDFSEQNSAMKSMQAAPVAQTLKRLNDWLSDIDVLIATSKDPFISEYVPKNNNIRYGVTGFSGSVGEGLVWLNRYIQKHKGKKPIQLFVDGRYHLQADQEVDANFVEVVKLECEPNIEGSWLSLLKNEKKLSIAVDLERLSVSTFEQLKHIAKECDHQLHFLSGQQLLQALDLPGWKVNRPVFSVPVHLTGRKPVQTLNSLVLEMNRAAKGGQNVLYATCATDDAAFLLNARGYHLPNQSSFLAYTFIARNQIILFLPDSSADSEINLDTEQLGDFRLTVIRRSSEELKQVLAKLSVTDVFFYGATMNALLPNLFSEVYPHAKLHSDFKWIVPARTTKTPEELESLRSSFKRSSKAIAKTLCYGKLNAVNETVTEKGLANQLYQNYMDEGAVSLSFTTICGAGPNSAIVHYNKPSEQNYFKKGQIALLDSGAYYESGLATDCTRNFFVGGSGTSILPEAWQTHIYTTALKAGIQVFLKPVPKALNGREVDLVIRNVVKNAGYDYLHGTGHGIGIHVHEEGIRFSTLSTYGQSAFACVSVEPGIYIENKGGVRIENVVLLHPEGTDHYRFENIVFVGYDWDLIDVSMLTNDEKTYLKNYEAQCRELGTQLMECPL